MSHSHSCLSFQYRPLPYQAPFAHLPHRTPPPSPYTSVTQLTRPDVDDETRPEEVEKLKQAQLEKVKQTGQGEYHDELATESESDVSASLAFPALALPLQMSWFEVVC